MVSLPFPFSSLASDKAILERYPIADAYGHGTRKEAAPLS